MDPTRFDVLTRRLARGASRRQVLKGLAAGLLGTTLPLTTSAAPRGNSFCAHFCATVFGADTPAADQCTSEAAHGTGLCFTCGPASPGGTQPLCCATNDAGLCTSYGDVTCPNFQTDVNNCNTCGNVCPGPTSGTGSPTCINGTCEIICSGNTPDVCGTACVNTLTDAGNCGACGNVCDPTTSTCANGACRLLVGQPCRYGGECSSQYCDLLGEHCAAGTCCAVAAGHACNASSDCTTSNCLGGICQQSGPCGPCLHQEDCLGFGVVAGVFCHDSSVCYPCA